MVPNYDKEQVYNSNIKKLFQWYNILHETKKLKFKEEVEEKEKKEHKKKISKTELKTKTKSTKQKTKVSTNQVPKKHRRQEKVGNQFLSYNSIMNKTIQLLILILVSICQFILMSKN